MKCPMCRGHGFVMTRDFGVAGAEEYGTCPRCRGTSKVDEALAPETMARKIRMLEAEVKAMQESLTAER